MPEQITRPYRVQSTKYAPERHKNLLLIADPDEAVLDAYIQDCKLYACEENGRLLGVAATLDLPDGSVELKNIAVDPLAQRGGIGSALLRFVCAEAESRRLIVGTADVSSEALAFYERNGFVRFGVIPNFFVDHYSEPVLDNGRPCRDMILLEWKGGPC
jgi:ribosomal protein S18 acetylase RimI-like enzyme